MSPVGKQRAPYPLGREITCLYVSRLGVWESGSERSTDSCRTVARLIQMIQLRGCVSTVMAPLPRPFPSGNVCLGHWIQLRLGDIRTS